MFKRSPSLTEQTKRYIKKRIMRNEFAGGRIPSENELAASLGVSRTTIRDALSRLEQEGVIVRRQGAGTFVNKLGLQIRSRLEEIWSYEKVLRDHGYTPSVRILHIGHIQASSFDAEQLQIAEGDELLLIEKLFLEDENPVILTRNAIPQTLVKQPIVEEDCRQPIYDLVTHACGLHLAYYLSDLVPVAADEYLAQQLDIAPQTPLISFDEVGFDSDNQPILKAISYFRDDFLRFRLIRRHV